MQAEVVEGRHHGKTGADREQDSQLNQS
jgi:hypothetical protein